VKGLICTVLYLPILRSNTLIYKTVVSKLCMHRDLRFIKNNLKCIEFFFRSVIHGIHNRAPRLNLVQKGHCGKKYDISTSIITSNSFHYELIGSS